MINGMLLKSQRVDLSYRKMPSKVAPKCKKITEVKEEAKGNLLSIKE